MKIQIIDLVTPEDSKNKSCGKETVSSLKGDADKKCFIPFEKIEEFNPFAEHIMANSPVRSPSNHGISPHDNTSDHSQNANFTNQFERSNSNNTQHAFNLNFLSPTK